MNFNMKRSDKRVQETAVCCWVTCDKNGSICNNDVMLRKRMGL